MRRPPGGATSRMGKRICAVGYATGPTDDARVCSGRRSLRSCLSSGPARWRETLVTGVGLALLTLCTLAAASPEQTPSSGLGLAKHAPLLGVPAGLPPGLPPLYGVDCPGLRRCVVVGGGDGSAMALSTTDGAHWVKAALPSSLHYLDSVSCTSTSDCVAVGAGPAGGESAATRDGTSWHQLAVPAGVVPLGSVSCVRAGCAAVGEQYDRSARAYRSSLVVLRGASWVTVALPGRSTVLESVSCTGNAYCWVGGGGDIFFSANLFGAKPTWATEVPQPAPSRRTGGVALFVRSVQFTNASDGTASGGTYCGGFFVLYCGGVIWRTTDGGAHWAVAQAPPQVPFVVAASCSATGCLALGQSFTNSVVLSSTQGAVWRQVEASAGFLYSSTCTSSLCLAVGTDNYGANGVLVSTLRASTATSVMPQLAGPRYRVDLSLTGPVTAHFSYASAPDLPGVSPPSGFCGAVPKSNIAGFFDLLSLPASRAIGVLKVLIEDYHGPGRYIISASAGGAAPAVQLSAFPGTYKLVAPAVVVVSPGATEGTISARYALEVTHPGRLGAAAVGTTGPVGRIGGTWRCAQLRSAVVTPAGRVSSIATSLVGPAQAFSPAVAVAVNVAITAGLVLFVTFPANLFNQTFSENYTDIVLWWRRKSLALLPGRVRQRLRSLTGTLGPAPGAGNPELSGVVAVASAVPPEGAIVEGAAMGRAHGPVDEAADGEGLDAVPSTEQAQKLKHSLAFAAVIAVGALLGSMLDPSFGPNPRTLTTWVAIALAIVAGVAVSGLVISSYHRARKHGRVSYRLEGLPLGLVVAAACVLISRLIGFQPGYLYGVIAGVKFGREPAKDEEGHLVALSSAATIVTALVAWAGWDALNPVASKPGAFFGGVVADDFLSSLFVGGLVGTAISLLPLRFLPGHKLRSWHKGAWAATFGLALFLLIDAVLRPDSHLAGRSHAPLVSAAILFVAFGLGSVVFHRHFAAKRKGEGGREEQEGDGHSGAVDATSPPTAGVAPAEG